MRYEQMASLPTLPDLKAMQQAQPDLKGKATTIKHTQTFNKGVELKNKFHSNGMIKDGDFDNKFLFMLKVINFFAMMSYDTCFELNQRIKEYNKQKNRNFLLSNKLRQAVKKMEDTRKRLEHHSLQATQELATLFEGIEDTDGKIKPLSFFFEIVDTFEYLLQIFGYLILECDEDPKELKELYHNLKNLLKTENIRNRLQEPDWNKLIELENGIKKK